VLFVWPIMLMVTALLVASLRSNTVRAMINEVLPSFLIPVLGTIVALLCAAAGFWFLYYFFPNTRVPYKSAAAGALVAAVLWQILQFLFLKLQVGVSRYNAIYGTFAAVPIFILWLHMSWLIVLFGAEVSYAHANQMDLEFGGLVFRPSPAYRQQLALGAMVIAGRAFLGGEPPPSCEDMARRLAAPVRVMREVIAMLVGKGLLSEVRGEQPVFQPAAPLEGITLEQITSTVQEDGDGSPTTIEALRKIGLAGLLDGRSETVKDPGITLREVVQSDTLPGREDP